MSSKSKQKGPNQKPRLNMSFAELMSQEQLNRLKPFIAHEISEARRALSMQQLAAIADLTASITVLQRLLVKAKLTTNEELKTLRHDVEDESYGLKATTEGAKDGDYVRTRIQTSYKEIDADNKELASEALAEQDLDIPRLLPDSNKAHPKVLEGLVDMKAGESKAVNYEVESPRGKYLVVSTLTVVRVSRAPEKKKEQAENAESTK